MALVPLAASTAQATQFINPSPITINDAPTDGVVTPATPSPSTISVSGQSGVVKSVEVDLSGFQHNSQKDVDVLLRGPGGQVVTLLSDIGGRPAASSVDLGLKAGAAPFPTPEAMCGTTKLTSGFFAPTDNDNGSLDCVPACVADPALDANNTSLATFNETGPNGTWELYVSDDCHIDAGSINGWTLDLTTGPPTPTSSPSQPGTAPPKKKCKKHKKHKKHKSGAVIAKKCKKKHH